MADNPLENTLPWQAVPAGHTTVVLVRHGRTAWNHQRRFLGHTDIPLDETGSRSAATLGPALEGQFDQVYCSPLSRAVATAEAFARQVVHVPELMELDQGEVEGMVAAEAIARFPEFFAAWAVDPTDAVVPGGESLGQVQERALRGLERLIEAHPGGRFAVVTHQMVIAALSCAAAGVGLERYPEYTVGNVGITVLTSHAGQLRLAVSGFTL